jgi:hypothetical protein
MPTVGTGIASSTEHSTAGSTCARRRAQIKQQPHTHTHTHTHITHKRQTRQATQEKRCPLPNNQQQQQQQQQQQPTTTTTNQPTANGANHQPPINNQTTDNQPLARPAARSEEPKGELLARFKV